jgi:hypothetical protein
MKRGISEKESHMRFVDPTRPYRKSGGKGARLFVVLPAVPNTSRGLIENLFLMRAKTWLPGYGDSCFKRKIAVRKSPRRGV